MAEKRSKELAAVFWISLGAVLGANLRYFLGGWIAQRWGAAFPWGTLVINLTGSLILGFFMTLITGRFLVDPRWRLLFAIGFLGSYTTFSTYTFESITLLISGNWLYGTLNLLGGSILGVLAALLGIVLARLV
jgi:fluoride exporter